MYLCSLLICVFYGNRPDGLGQLRQTPQYLTRILVLFLPRREKLGAWHNGLMVFSLIPSLAGLYVLSWIDHEDNEAACRSLIDLTNVPRAVGTHLEE